MSNPVKDNYDVVVVGGGPAGMTAAINCRKFGASTLLIDENERLGGQLTKQTHKFFGSKMHYAGYRGFEIANILKEEAVKLDVDVLTSANVWHIAANRAFVSRDAKSFVVDFKKCVIATGARERPVYFPNWTLPNVMYAGALQTLVNVYRVSPGKSAVIIGAGNVGLIVAYQVIQAGIEVKAIVEARDKVGGYEVHRNKIKAAGVPIFLSSRIRAAFGNCCVEGVEIISKGQAKRIDTEMVCIAAGMTSQNALLGALDVDLHYVERLNDFLPRLNSEQILLQDEDLAVAGDAAGVEEASIAMEEGRLAGLSVCKSLSLLGKSDEHIILQVQERLGQLRNEIPSE